MNSAELSQNARSKIRFFSKRLAENPDLNLELIGYYDNRASDEKDSELASRRTAAVRDEIIRLIPELSTRIIESIGNVFNFPPKVEQYNENINKYCDSYENQSFFLVASFIKKRQA